MIFLKANLGNSAARVIMEGLFTRLSESFADLIAPKMARISLAAGIYIWLLSRAFASRNRIGISVSTLAEIFRKDRRSIQRAITRLIDEGLIVHETYRRNGGGSIFRVLGLNDTAFSLHQNKDRCDKFATPGASNWPYDATGRSHQVRPEGLTTKKRGIYSEKKSRPQSPYDR